MTNALSLIETNINPNLLYIGDKMDKTISAISAKLGVATDHFWPLLVKKQCIDGWTGLVLICLGILCMIIGFYIANKNKNPKAHEAPASCVIPAVISIALVFVLTIAIPANFQTIINQILNPEAIALTEFLKNIR